MRVNFSITNQLATPSIHAAALANRPPAGQPGRLFVDTDSPSTGIYRDTGTVWILISSPGAPEADTLQAVTDRGNTTTNNIVLQYGNTEDANKINFYNTTLSESEYVIEKRGAGGTTNDVLTLEATGSNTNTGNPLGLYVDGSQENLITYYGPSYQGRGLRLNLGSEVYEIGDFNGTSDGTLIAASSTSRTIVLTAGGNNNATILDIDDIAQTIRTLNDGDEKGLKLDFGSKNYEFGNFDTSKGNIKIYDYDLLDYAIEIRTIPPNYNVDLSINLIPDEQINLNAKSENNPNNIYSRYNLTTGQINSEVKNFNVGSQITQGYNTIVINTYDNDNSANIVHDTLLDFQNNIARYLTQYNGNDIGLKLDFANNIYQIGVTSNITGGGLAINAGARNYSLGDFNELDNATYLNVDDSLQLIKTVNNGNDIGIKLDFGIFSYKFGDFNITNNGVYLECDDDNGIIRLYSGGGHTNFEGDGSTTYIGDVGGAVNQTRFGVDDTNQKLIASSNLLVGSSGATSGQHLKIKVGTTDYVIELKNP